ncbi:unnamed protein product [Brassicogethes aeneus]|uniref:BOD1/SHG1 domain-containing protein n=1 Tax=Brassicogethes aeneus TaxID=1431903 RepID=A0A9P0B3W3_BRAAE|nr:unnamed protein product [Brassicogethes aeneus]
MEVVRNSFMPGDPRLIDQIVYELKSQGIFDQFRKECISDVDTKPAYQNLRQRVEGSVSSFLKQQKWRPDMNKNQVREMLRKSIHESGYLETGVERIVDQVVNPKINSVFLPQVEDVVYRFLGIERPDKDNKKGPLKIITQNDLLPTDLEAVSPESTHNDKKDDSNLDDSINLDESKVEEDESPPFEPLDEQSSYVPQEENSVDSHMSGFSGLASHDSNNSVEMKNTECSNQDSHISHNSSESRLSIVTSEDNTKMEICEETNQSKSATIAESNPSVTEADSNNDRKLDEKSSKHRSDDKKRSSEKYSSRDKDKERKHSTSSGSNKDKPRHSSSSSSRDKDKDKKDYKSSSSKSASKDKDKDKSRSSSSGNRHGSSKDKSTSKSSSSSSNKDKDSSRDKDKSKSSSSTHRSKSSSSSDKYKKHSSSSSSKKDKDKDRKKETKKDDHYSSREKKSDRRSTDRDSNDGQSSKQGNNSCGEQQSSQSQKSSQESSKSTNGNGSGESGNSDGLESKTVNLSEIVVPPKVKLYKPKFASNFQEARRLMKIRKKLAKLEKQQQLGLASFEAIEIKTKPSPEKVELEEEVLKSSTISQESFEALEARLLQEMSNIDYNTYESPDDDDYERFSLKDTNIVEDTIVREVIIKEPEVIQSEETLKIDEPELQTPAEPETPKINDVPEVEAPTVPETPNREETLTDDLPIEESEKATPLKTLTVPLSDCLLLKNKNIQSQDECLYLEPPTQSELSAIDLLHKRIQRIEDDILRRSSKVDKTVDAMNRKRKIPAKNQQKKMNESLQKRMACSKVNNNKVKSTEIPTNNNFPLPLSPSDSESNEKKEELSEVPLKRRRRSGQKSNQRYSSDDLYKPRPIFASTRRRGAQPKGE